MAKTAAQKAARKRRRQARKARKGGMLVSAPKPQVQNRQKRRKNRLPQNKRVVTGVGRLNAFGNNTTNRRIQVIEEDEFIADVNGSVNFATTQFAVNPGQSAVFPWGSRPSSNYSEYQFEYLEFYYKPEVSGFATQGQTGKVILSFDYDATATVPTTKQQVEAIDPHVDSLPCEAIKLVVDCAQIHKGDSKYVRPGTQPANTDLKTYDAGVLSVSTIGEANTTLIGELHVRYRVRLEKPLLDPAVVAGGVIHFSSIAATTANNFAAAALQAGGTNTMTGITLGTNTIVFPAGIPGNYLIWCNVAGATSATASGNFSGGTALNLFTNGSGRDSTNTELSAASTGTNQMSHTGYAVTIPNASTTITLSPSTIVGTGIMDLFIISLPVTVLTKVKPVSDSELRDEVSELRSLVSSLLRSQPAPLLVATASDSEADAPDECKESELSQSVHIPKSMAAKLGALIMKK